MAKKLRAFALLGVLCSSTAVAQWPVIDVAAIARLADQIHWLKKQYETMTETYKTVLAQ